MKGLVTLTHLLFPLFLGMIIGFAIIGNTASLVFAIVMLALDIIIGCTLQYFVDRSSYKDDWNRLTFEEKRAEVRNILETVKSDMRREGIDIDKKIEEFCDAFNKEHGLGKYSHVGEDEEYEYEYYEEEKTEEELLCEHFREVYSSINAEHGERLLTFKNIRTDEAGKLLLDLCEYIPHAPLMNTLYGLYEVFVHDLDGVPAIFYKFLHTQNSICENVYIVLVLTDDEKIRFFALETHYSSYMLCEYSGHSHINYGNAGLQNFMSKIVQILNSDQGG